MLITGMLLIGHQPVLDGPAGSRCSIKAKGPYSFLSMAFLDLRTGYRCSHCRVQMVMVFRSSSTAAKRMAPLELVLATPKAAPSKPPSS